MGRRPKTPGLCPSLSLSWKPPGRPTGRTRSNTVVLDLPFGTPMERILFARARTRDELLGLLVRLMGISREPSEGCQGR